MCTGLGEMLSVIFIFIFSCIRKDLAALTLPKTHDLYAPPLPPDLPSQPPPTATMAQTPPRLISYRWPVGRSEVETKMFHVPQIIGPGAIRNWKSRHINGSSEPAETWKNPARFTRDGLPRVNLGWSMSLRLVALIAICQLTLSRFNSAPWLCRAFFSTSHRWNRTVYGMWHFVLNDVYLSTEPARRMSCLEMNCSKMSCTENELLVEGGARRRRFENIKFWHKFLLDTIMSIT